MKKILPIVVIILVLLGVSYFLLKGKENVSPEKTEENGSVQVQKEQGNIFTSIKDAIAKSMSLKCEYPDEKGNKVEAEASLPDDCKKLIENFSEIND